MFIELSIEGSRGNVKGCCNVCACATQEESYSG